MTVETLRRDLVAVDADLETTERQAALADAGDLSRLGGLLAGLTAKRKAIESALSQALGIEAAKARAAEAKAAEAERAAFRAKLAELERQWDELMGDFDEAGAIVEGLWDRYNVIRHANASTFPESQRLNVALGGYNVGALSGAALEAKQGYGVLAWKG